MTDQTNAQYLADILPKLAAPMPYRWRVQSFNKKPDNPLATCVAYIDARDAMDRLDSVCLYGWEREHKELKGLIYCGVTIIMPQGGRITRWDCGTESNTEAEKGESSDSFKRAAVNWGVGRFLYDLSIVRVKAKASGNFWDPVTDDGKKIWDLTAHINGMRKPGNQNGQMTADDIANNNQTPRVQPSNQTIGDAEFKTLMELLDETGADKQAFCKAYKITSVAALPMAGFAHAVGKLQEKKRTAQQHDQQQQGPDYDPLQDSANQSVEFD